MTGRMTSRDRVLAAMRREEPDRVPLVLWGSYFTINYEPYFGVLKHLDLGDPLPPFLY